MKVDFYRHDLQPSDAERIARVLATPFLTTGQVSRGVEGQLREYFGVPHACLVNSWTNGALAVLLAMDLQPGDEVIVPAMTFIASANVVELAGAKVVFADVEPDVAAADARDRGQARHRAHARRHAGSHLRPALRRRGHSEV